MIDPFIIEYIKKIRRKEIERDSRIPLTINPPVPVVPSEDLDKKNDSDKGYVEIDMYNEPDGGSITIKM